MFINLVVFRLNTWSMWSFSLSGKLYKLLVRLFNYVKVWIISVAFIWNEKKKTKYYLTLFKQNTTKKYREAEV
jgi:hypothetical protein